MVSDSRDDPITLLCQWKQAIRICHRAHTRSAAFMLGRNRALGIPVVVLTTAAGTTVFATLESSPETWLRILVGLVSVTAAVLASLQTFLGYGERAEQHKTAALKYGVIRREIEETLALHATADTLPDGLLESLRKRWDAVDEESPSLSQSLYDRTAERVLNRPQGG